MQLPTCPRLNSSVLCQLEITALWALKVFWLQLRPIEWLDLIHLPHLARLSCWKKCKNPITSLMVLMVSILEGPFSSCFWAFDHTIWVHVGLFIINNWNSRTATECECVFVGLLSHSTAYYYMLHGFCTVATCLILFIKQPFQNALTSWRRYTAVMSGIVFHVTDRYVD